MSLNRLRRRSGVLRGWGGGESQGASSCRAGRGKRGEVAIDDPGNISIISRLEHAAYLPPRILCQYSVVPPRAGWQEGVSVWQKSEREECIHRRQRILAVYQPRGHFRCERLTPLLLFLTATSYSVAVRLDCVKTHRSIFERRAASENRQYQPIQLWYLSSRSDCLSTRDHSLKMMPGVAMTKGPVSGIPFTLAPRSNFFLFGDSITQAGSKADPIGTCCPPVPWVWRAS